VSFLADRDADGLAARAERNARAALAAGVTTVRDCGSTFEVLRVRDAIAAGRATGPRILAAGPPITTTRGHCFWWGGEADTEADVLAAVEERAKRGADAVKIMTTGGIMTPESDPLRLQYPASVVAAATLAAHAAGLPVVVHALTAEAIDVADAAGVDSIDHAIWPGPDGARIVNPAVVRRIASARRAVGVTTSGVVRVHLDNGTDGEAALRDAMADKVVLAGAGARIHVHSDAGVRFTAFDRPDLSLRAAAIGMGMRPVAAIAAMTSVAAHVLGLGGVVGSLRSGLHADLLIVDGDPSVDLRAIHAVRGVWRDGRAVVEGAHV
jgi:imidazolonepropionase-like amidohydrolase